MGSVKETDFHQGLRMVRSAKSPTLADRSGDSRHELLTIQARDPQVVNSPRRFPSIEAHHNRAHIH